MGGEGGAGLGDDMVAIVTVCACREANDSNIELVFKIGSVHYLQYVVLCSQTAILL